MTTQDILLLLICLFGVIPTVAFMVYMIGSILLGRGEYPPSSGV